MTRYEPFIMLPYATYDSPIFLALEPIHIAVLLLLIRKHDGYNNGKIALGVRETARRCHCSQATACRALARLQNDGLISVTYKGHLVAEVGRANAASRWCLNFLPESRPMNGRFAADAHHASQVVLRQRYGDNLRARLAVMLAKHQ